jgi:hypothetical protein
VSSANQRARTDQIAKGHLDGNLEEPDYGDLEEFLENAADEELQKFFRRLPMIAGMESGKVQVSDLIYEIKLWPFVKTAWKLVEERPGFPGRLLQIAAIYRLAEWTMEQETGETRRFPRVIDVPTFTRLYHSGEFP